MSDFALYLLIALLVQAVYLIGAYMGYKFFGVNQKEVFITLNRLEQRLVFYEQQAKNKTEKATVAAIRQDLYTITHEHLGVDRVTIAQDYYQD